MKKIVHGAIHMGLGVAIGFVAAKWGKDICAAVRENVGKSSIIDLVNEIKADIDKENVEVAEEDADETVENASNGETE